MKNSISILILFCVAFLNAQQKRVINALENTPAEEIFIHYNASTFLPGESLRYKLYNLIEKDHHLSGVSKVAYVQLFNANGEPVFSHILELEDGTGYSDFLIPSSLPTGVYTLVGYTQWMKNFDYAGMFRENILVLNPYLKESDGNVKINRETETETVSQSIPSFKNGSSFKIQLNKEVYGSREKVSVKLEDPDEFLNSSALSISVRKEETPLVNMASTGNYEFSNPADFNFKVLPEVRGRQLKGEVLSENGEPLSSKIKMALSVPGNTSAFRVFETSEDGSFDYQLDGPVSYREAFIEILNKDADFQVKLDSIIPELSIAKPEMIEIPGDYIDQLEEKSLHNQIQQSYRNVFADSVIPFNKNQPFFGNRGEVYHLDDYTRFSTMQETFVEIIPFTSFKKKGDGYEASVYSKNFETDFGDAPLVLIDGIMISSHDYLYNFDSMKIEDIIVLRDKYYFGAKTFQGVIAIKTKDGNEGVTYSANKVRLRPSEPGKNYATPDYSMMNKETSSRIPDYRYQLYWSPELKSDSIEFYTSDVAGKYSIKIEGFRENGKPISLEKTFEVK